VVWREEMKLLTASSYRCHDNHSGGDPGRHLPLSFHSTLSRPTNHQFAENIFTVGDNSVQFWSREMNRPINSFRRQWNWARGDKFIHFLRISWKTSQLRPKNTGKHFFFWLTVHLSITLENDQLDTHLFYFILQYVYYNPLHVSIIICSLSGGWNVLMLHLVSSLSESDRPVHRLKEDWFSPLSRCCINTIQPPDDEHIMLETCSGL